MEFQLSLSKFLDPKNDFAFKKIFGTEKNKDILIHFLNDMLVLPEGRKIESVVFLKPSQDPEISYQKQSLVDVLCADHEGRQYIVEMQVAKFEGFEKRAQYYAAKAYSGQLNIGENYKKLKEIIFLAITDFVMFPKKLEYKSDHVILDKHSYQHDLKDFSFTFLELPKFNKDMNELSTMVEKWAYFFKHAHHTSEQDSAHLAESDEIIGRAYEELNQFSWSIDELRTYEDQQKKFRDARAIEDYRQKQAIEMEQKMEELEENQKKFDENQKEFDENQKKFDEHKKEFDEHKKELEENQKEFDEHKKELEEDKKELRDSWQKLAQSMLVMGHDFKKIQEMTGLSESEINALR